MHKQISWWKRYPSAIFRAIFSPFARMFNWLTGRKPKVQASKFQKIILKILSVLPASNSCKEMIGAYSLDSIISIYTILSVIMCIIMLCFAIRIFMTSSLKRNLVISKNRYLINSIVFIYILKIIGLFTFSLICAFKFKIKLFTIDFYKLSEFWPILLIIESITVAIFMLSIKKSFDSVRHRKLLRIKDFLVSPLFANMSLLLMLIIAKKARLDCNLIFAASLVLLLPDAISVLTTIRKIPNAPPVQFTYFRVNHGIGPQYDSG